MRIALRIAAAAAVILSAVLAPPAAAQTWPSKPVRVLIPFPPGGDTDGALRIGTNNLAKVFGQTFVVESRPGGNTVIAAEAVAKSAPDGYTLFFCGPTTFTINPSLYAGKLPYDYARDFTPIGTLSTSPYFIVVSSTLPAKSLKDMLAMARAEPGKYSFASTGTGSSSHLAYEILVRNAGVNMVHVPYKGLQIAVPDVLSGRVMTLMSGMAVAGAMTKAGKLSVLAVTSASRSTLMPEVPTVAESGLPGYDIVTWFGLFAPAQTPHDIVTRLSAELRSFLATADAREAYRNLGHEAFGTTPEQLAALVRSDSEKYSKVIREAGIKAE